MRFGLFLAFGFLLFSDGRYVWIVGCRGSCWAEVLRVWLDAGGVEAGLEGDERIVKRVQCWKNSPFADPEAPGHCPGLHQASCYAYRRRRPIHAIFL